MPKTLAALPSPQPQSTTDQVYDALFEALVTLRLAPGSKVSEMEIAKQLGVSRQPVRDAFFRLSQSGFLSIRPQRATLITKIADTAVLQAAFVRAALEAACIRDLAATIRDDELAELDALLADQQAAIDAGQRRRFHELDDQLHLRMCQMSGHGYVWPLIQDRKAHIDRVRYLSLSFGQQDAFNQHLDILAALRARDPDRAETVLRDHLSRIRTILPIIRAGNRAFFEDDDA